MKAAVREQAGENRKVSAMGIVLSKTGPELEVLIVENDGEWVFPKGHVEDGEDLTGAAIREVQEETGATPAREDHRGMSIPSVSISTARKPSKSRDSMLFHRIEAGNNHQPRRGVHQRPVRARFPGRAMLTHDDARGGATS